MAKKRDNDSAEATSWEQQPLTGYGIYYSSIS